MSIFFSSSNFFFTHKTQRGDSDHQPPVSCELPAFLARGASYDHLAPRVGMPASYDHLEMPRMDTEKPFLAAYENEDDAHMLMAMDDDAASVSSRVSKV